MRTRAAGFTLVEVLVSVLVFAILAASAYVALDGLSAASGHHQQRSERFADIQRAVSRLDADLRQLTSRPARDFDGTLQPALAGRRGQLTASRAGWVNPAGQSRSQLQRFGWSLADETLSRTAWPVTDLVPGTPEGTEAVLRDVMGFELRYLDRVGQWHQDWPPAGQPAAALPAAVEYVLELLDRGIIRRLVVLEP